MRKLMILCAACLITLCAMAQTEEINAVKFVQGQTIDWYLLADNPEVTFTDHNPVISGKTYDLANGNVETEFGTAPAEKITLTAADFTVTKDGDWKYDQTEKRVKVEFISVENPGPPADKVEIYYNNDKMVKPIEPGTYQVYIDIEETDTYAAVTGITSDAWKFDIIDPLPEIKAAAIAEIKNAAATANEEIDGLGVDESAKSEAKAHIDNIVNTAEQTINAATSKDAIDNAKTQAIADIHNVVQTTKDLWVTLRTDVTAGNWNTICMERNITAIDGATFWNVVSETSTEFILEQVSAPFPAGVGYIIRYTATELKVKYGDQVADAPVDAEANELPIQGRFTEITCDQTGYNELVDNYVVYQNQLCMVTGWVTMADHRAYVIAGKAPSEAPAPHGAPRMTMSKPSEVPTSLGGEADRQRGGKAMKVIENGQFRIVRDNKMYNAQGIEL